MEAEQLGQLLLTGLPGTQLDPDTARRLKKLQPGGIILFGRNIESPEQVRKLIDDVRDLSNTEPIVTIDQEGGRVSRLRLIGSEPPNAMQLREKGERDLIKRHGVLTGDILRVFGFNLDLCPVLDYAEDDAADNSLKGRCYGKTPQQVVEFAGVFNRSMRSKGILSCGKHFPGYSNAGVDAHHELPVIDRTREELERDEILPFRALMPELDSIMTCHSHYPCFDADRPRWPASLSKNIITGFLRHQLGFEGLIMTDDLDMGAILNEVTFEDTIKSAIRAGNDMLMICHRLEMVEQAHKHLQEMPDTELFDAVDRMRETKKKLAPPYAFTMDRFHEIDSKIWQLRVDTLGEEEAKKLSVEDGKRSPVETY